MSQAEIYVAVVGHPSEGKSSVIATLAERDDIRISARSPETRECHAYDIEVGGRIALRLMDTPGFQRPREACNEFKKYEERIGADNIAATFLQEHGADARFATERKILTPLAEGAGLIYVVDASRPISKDDRYEVEILRLTGRPRLAIINSKTEDATHVDAWYSLLNSTFNLVRLFNAHTASFTERMNLLRALGQLDKGWNAELEQVVTAFEEDWRSRMEECADAILDCVEEMVTVRVAKTCADDSAREKAGVTEWVSAKYREKLVKRERECHQAIRRAFKHQLFDPAPVVELQHDLLDEETWRLLGLNSKQLRRAFMVAGAAVGLSADVAFAGLSLGVGTGTGAAAGYVLGRFALQPLSVLRAHSRKGSWLNRSMRREIYLGPARNVQLVFILLDRALGCAHLARNWTHARRDHESAVPVRSTAYTRDWESTDRDAISRFHAAILRGSSEKIFQERAAVRQILLRALQ